MDEGPLRLPRAGPWLRGARLLAPERQELSQVRGLRVPRDLLQESPGTGEVPRDPLSARALEPAGAAMSQVILEFPLDRDDVKLFTDTIAVELGNGVRLTTGIPQWVKGINAAKLQIVLDIEGSPDAVT